MIYSVCSFPISWKRLPCSLLRLRTLTTSDTIFNQKRLSNKRKLQWRKTLSSKIRKLWRLKEFPWVKKCDRKLFRPCWKSLTTSLRQPQSELKTSKIIINRQTSRSKSMSSCLRRRRTSCWPRQSWPSSSTHRNNRGGLMRALIIHRSLTR